MDGQSGATADNNRCRVKMSQNSKGLWQLEATAEYDDPDTAAEQLFKALKIAREKAAADGLQLVS